MTQPMQIYRCNVCGNIVKVLRAGAGQLVCCGQPMELLTEKKNDVGQEKHVPVLEPSAKGTLVKVSSVPHPMEETHFIEWIEIITQHGACRITLQPGNQPQAEFCVPPTEILKARIYCNVHSLWSN
ncbi:MAG: desulfoferrodoxin [bacterium]|nr:desulfoferrodoxin [bacterium]